MNTIVIFVIVNDSIDMASMDGSAGRPNPGAHKGGFSKGEFSNK